MCQNVAGQKLVQHVTGLDLAVAHVEEGAVTGLEARQALQHAREEAQQLVDQAQAALQQRKLQHSHSDPAASRKQPSYGAAGKALTGPSSNALHGATSKVQQQSLPTTAPGLLKHPIQGSTASYGANSSALEQLQMAGASQASGQIASSLLDRMQSAQGAICWRLRTSLRPCCLCAIPSPLLLSP